MAGAQRQIRGHYKHSTIIPALLLPDSYQVIAVSKSDSEDFWVLIVHHLAIQGDGIELVLCHAKEFPSGTPLLVEIKAWVQRDGKWQYDVLPLS
jgi:hypothetical protein